MLTFLKNLWAKILDKLQGTIEFYEGTCDYPGCKETQVITATLFWDNDPNDVQEHELCELHLERWLSFEFRTES